MKKEGGGHDNQGKTQLSTSLTDMSMFATTVSQLESPLPSQHILTPCSFQLDYSSPSSADKDLFIFLESQGSVDFVLCPLDIRVVLGVVQATQRPMVGGVVLVDCEGSLCAEDVCVLCVVCMCVLRVCVCAGDVRACMRSHAVPAGWERLLCAGGGVGGWGVHANVLESVHVWSGM